MTVLLLRGRVEVTDIEGIVPEELAAAAAERA
jgi:hypothetical protein